jgi:hypothetical protein
MGYRADQSYLWREAMPNRIASKLLAARSRLCSSALVAAAVVGDGVGLAAIAALRGLRGELPSILTAP